MDKICFLSHPHSNKSLPRLAMAKPGLGRLLARLVGSGAALILAGCAVNPVTGDRELGFVSEAQERSIGQEQY